MPCSKKYRGGGGDEVAEMKQIGYDAPHAQTSECAESETSAHPDGCTRPAVLFSSCYDLTSLLNFWTQSTGLHYIKLRRNV